MKEARYKHDKKIDIEKINNSYSIMIIPIRCFTCGSVLANKWKTYEKMCESHTEKNKKDLHPSFEDRKGEVLDKLEIKKICCRRHFLAHVDMIDII
jgi:DNA-directed RNA polymerases I, II, and III subunit RPABC5